MTSLVTRLRRFYGSLWSRRRLRLSKSEGCDTCSSQKKVATNKIAPGNSHVGGRAFGSGAQGVHGRASVRVDQTGRNEKQAMGFLRSNVAAVAARLTASVRLIRRSALWDRRPNQLRL